jgi:acyl carrier protein
MLETIKDLLSRQFGVDPGSITVDTDIIRDLGADSLDLVELVMDFESTFKVAIEEDEYAQCNTVAKMVNLVEKKVSARG